MKTLFTERGYKILSNVEDSLGFYPDELLAIAKQFAPNTYQNANKYFGEKEAGLSAKAILDHYFKIDDLLELPRAKKTDPVKIVGIQWYSYSENWSAEEVDQKVTFKLKQLKGTQEACEEIFLAGTFVIAGYVPSYWEGIGLRTDEENRRIMAAIDSLVLEMSSGPLEPTRLDISFDFK